MKWSSLVEVLSYQVSQVTSDITQIKYQVNMITSWTYLMLDEFQFSDPDHHLLPADPPPGLPQPPDHPHHHPRLLHQPLPDHLQRLLLQEENSGQPGGALQSV